jgi:hypothetical protein
MAGSQADLVAIGGIARRRGLGQLPLGQLALQGLVKGYPGVAAAGEAHGLVDIHAPGEGIPDAAADAGGRTAEGLDLGGVVVGLVLEHEQPVLLLAVHHGGDLDGAGVDLLALIQLGEQAPLFQRLGADGGDVHQGLGPLGGLLLPIDLHTGVQIPLIGGLDRGGADVHRVQMGGEGGVAAVVGPVGVHHPHLGNGGVPLLLVPEVGLEEFQVIQIHRQAQLRQKMGQPLLVQGGEALHHSHAVGGGVLPDQSGGLVYRGLAALHRVDKVLADLLQFVLGQLAAQEVDLGVGDEGAVHAGLELDALGAGVGPLVELAGEGLHRQNAVDRVGSGIGLVPDVVHLGLGKHHRLGRLIDRGIDVVRVIAVQDPDGLQGLHPQLLPQLTAQALGLYVKAGLLF